MSHVYGTYQMELTQCCCHFFRIALPSFFFNFIYGLQKSIILSSKMTYVIPKVRTNYGTFNIRFQSAKVWNDISDDIKLLPLKIFKKNLKLILLEKY